MFRSARAKWLPLLVTTLLGISLLTPPNTYATQEPTRLAGTTRYETSTKIADVTKQTRLNAVILASGTDFPDALSSTAFSHTTNAPILLVDKNVETSKDALNYILNNLDKSGKIYIIGGTSILPIEFEAYLNANSYFNLERIGGTDRYDTNILLAEKCEAPLGTPVVLAYGEAYPDALAISSIASKNNWVTLLVGPNGLTDTTKTYITAHQPTAIHLVGGVGVLSQDLELQLQTTIPTSTITRHAGTDRFETATKLLQALTPNPKTLYLTTGYDYADALSGTTLASQQGDPLILLDPAKETIPESTATYLQTLVGKDVSIVALGGTAVLSDQLIKNVANIVNGTVSPKDLYTIPPTTIEVTEGDTLTLPVTVKGTLYDTTTIDLPIVWEQKPLSTATPATLTVNGVVTGYDKPVTLTINVLKKKESYEALKAQILTYLGKHTNNVGLTFKDLTNGTTFSINGDTQFLAASTAKLPIVITLYDLIAEGRLTEDQTILFQQGQQEGGTGILQRSDLSKPYSYATLAKYALTISDNIATIMIKDSICGRDELYTRLKTLIGHDQRNDQGSNVFTPNGAMTMLDKLYTGAKNGNQNYQKIITYLTQTVSHNRLDRDLPYNLVAHKIGNLRNATNDIGIFLTDKPYILTVYTFSLPNPNNTIAEISNMVYDYQAKHGN